MVLREINPANKDHRNLNQVWALSVVLKDWVDKARAPAVLRVASKDSVAVLIRALPIRACKVAIRAVAVLPAQVTLDAVAAKEVTLPAADKVECNPFVYLKASRRPGSMIRNSHEQLSLPTV
jgi:hypothetical protein